MKGDACFLAFEIDCLHSPFVSKRTVYLSRLFPRKPMFFAFLLGIRFLKIRLAYATSPSSDMYLLFWLIGSPVLSSVGTCPQTHLFLCAVCLWSLAMYMIVITLSFS